MEFNLKPGLIWAPWIVMPYRGKWLNIWDNFLIDILPKKLSNKYLLWLSKKSIKVKARFIGDPSKYKNKKINPNYYQKLFI